MLSKFNNNNPVHYFVNIMHNFVEVYHSKNTFYSVIYIDNY